jgi:hypothetical protein
LAEGRRIFLNDVLSIFPFGRFAQRDLFFHPSIGDLLDSGEVFRGHGGKRLSESFCIGLLFKLDSPIIEMGVSVIKIALPNIFGDGDWKCRAGFHIFSDGVIMKVPAPNTERNP